MHPAESARRNMQEQNSARILSSAYENFREKSIKAKPSTVEGDPKEMISQVAEQMQADLIVRSSRGLGRIKRDY